MKRIGGIWDTMTSVDTILLAIANAARGKRRLASVRRIQADPLKYAERLSAMLREGRFVPSDYTTMELCTRYGKKRTIMKLPFYPDRVVQHAVSLVISGRLSASLIEQTYACVPGRGIVTRSGRGSFQRAIRRAICSYKGRTVYCLVVDVTKYYPSVDVEVLKEEYRRYIKDERVLTLLDAICSKADCLPIGSYLSQIFANMYLSVLDHHVKEVMGVRHYFRYMDNMLIFGEDKAMLQQYKWRIANFLWYRLHLELNSMRQVFPLGRSRAERGLDLGGYVYYQGFTLMRKSIKQAMARRRRLPKSLVSYSGWAGHCESAKLIDKIITRDNKDMTLEEILGGKKIERRFEGDNIKIEQIIDKEIEVLDFEFIPSKKKADSEYLKMQIRFEGAKRFVGGGYQFLGEVLKLIDKKTQLPFTTVIRNKRGYYFEGTIKED